MGFVSNAFDLEFEDLELIARQRHEAHKHQDSHRQLSDDYELIGLIGEWGFARFSNLDMDLALRPAGDGRVDFEVNGFTIDVKSANKPYNLLREVEVPHADVLVLAGVWLDRRAYRLIGWEFDKAMLDMIITDRFGKYLNPPGPLNHYKPAEHLLSMNQLREEVL